MGNAHSFLVKLNMDKEFSKFIRFVKITFLALFSLLLFSLFYFSVAEHERDIDGVILSDSLSQVYRLDKSYRIEQVYVSQGDIVSAGDKIATFEDKQLMLDISSNELEHTKLSTKYQLADAEISTLEQLNKNLALEKSLIAESEEFLVDEELAKNQELKDKLFYLEQQNKKTREMLDNLKSDNQGALSLYNKLTLESDLHDKILLEAHTKRNENNLPKFLKKIKHDYRLKVQSIDKSILNNNAQILRLQASKSDLEYKVMQKKQELVLLYELHDNLTVKAKYDGFVSFLNEDLIDTNRITTEQTLFIVRQKTQETFSVLMSLTDKQYKDMKKGLSVDISIHAWNHFKSGVLKGTIVSLSEDKVNSRHFNKKSFTAKVAIDYEDNYFGDLRHGYVAKCKVLVRNLPVYQYLIKQFTQPAKV